MKLIKTRTIKIKKEYLEKLEKIYVIHSKELQEDGKYLVTYTKYDKSSYEQLVNKLVKERYSDSDEFAILRKAINGITEEFLTYNTYVEECKVRAQAFIAERESALNE